MTRRFKAFLFFGALGMACYTGGNGSGSPDAGLHPFQADNEYVYVAKVKNVMTGLAPTADEVQSVVAAPDTASKRAALVALLDQWMTTPEYRIKMIRFFELAFQQTQITQADFDGLVPNGNGSIGESPFVNLLVENVAESFARTVVDYIIPSNLPLSAAFTTNQFMLTPALAELYAFMDWNAIDDNEKIQDKFAAQPKIASLGITVEDTTPIAYSDTIDPNGTNYMHWYFPGLSTIQPTQPAGCQTDTRTWVSTNFNNAPSAHLVHYLLYGALDAYKVNSGPPPNNDCNAYQSSNANAVMTASDFTTWKLVTIRQPASGERATPFWDMSKLRTATELVLTIPRIGFFSTPAFHANWPTNTSNQMRVTMNQAFIVALGAQVDGSDPTNPGDDPPGLDAKHTNAVGACVSCHRVLDPSRALLQSIYTNGYGAQTSPPPSSGEFVFNGVVQASPYATLTDLGNALAKHPFFANAWAQKLCFWANSQACDAADHDPELQKIVEHFTQSNQSWKVMVEDVMSSPITTNAASTVTTTHEGELVSVARKDHLCKLLDARLKLNDSCGLQTITSKALTGIPEIAAGLPSDGYGRGAPVPVLPTSPTLFFRAGLENVCEQVAAQIIDSPPSDAGANSVTYSSATLASVNAAIADFVGNLMAIVPDDPRSAVFIQKLTDHYNQALASSVLDAGGKITASDALKSTFVVACLSPNVTGLGM